jgi:hypothetical protein
MARLHRLIGQHLVDLDDDADTIAVAAGIESDRGPWVRALVAAGYHVFAVNPLRAARFRQRRSVGREDRRRGCTHVGRHGPHRPPPAPPGCWGQLAEPIKVVTRAHKTLIWERTRHTQRLWNALREFFPGALEAFEDLASPDALELLSKAPDPATAARLTRTQITAALRRARRRNLAERVEQIQAALRPEQLTLGCPPCRCARPC